MNFSKMQCASAMSIERPVKDDKQTSESQTVNLSLFQLYLDPSATRRTKNVREYLRRHDGRLGWVWFDFGADGWRGRLFPLPQIRLSGRRLGAVLATKSAGWGSLRGNSNCLPNQEAPPRTHTRWCFEHATREPRPPQPHPVQPHSAESFARRNFGGQNGDGCKDAGLCACGRLGIY
eukprot:29010_3